MYVSVCELPKKSKRVNGVLPHEPRMADIRGGVLQEGQLAPSPPARGFGERCKLSQWAPAAQRFSWTMRYQASYSTMLKGRTATEVPQYGSKGVVPAPWLKITPTGGYQL